jgi:hypothetical protein
MTKVIVCRQCNFTVLAKDQDNAVRARAKHELETNDYIILIRDVQNVISDERVSA